MTSQSAISGSLEPQAKAHGFLEQSPAVQGSKVAFSQWLDLIRWVAALSVVLGHASNRFFVRLTSLDSAHRSVPFYIFTLLAGFAHEAVMIFFVLSGYLVGGGLWKESRRSPSIDLKMYLMKRVTRLCIVLYPTFILILLLNLIGIFTFHGTANGIYSAKALSSMQPSGFACNAGFMQTALCQPYGDDGALWSLYNEFWYYLVWPLVLLGIMAASFWRRSVLLLSAILILTILTVIQLKGTSAIGPYMAIWGLGILVAAVRKPLIRSVAISAGFFLIGLSANRLLVRREYEDLHPIGGFLVDLAIGLLFANLVATMRFSSTLRSPLGGKWNTWLASFSFSLYCIHIPILNLYGAAWKFYTGTGWYMVPDALWKWAIVFGAIGLCMASAYGLSCVTEARTEQLRRYLLRLLGSAREPKIT